MFDEIIGEKKVYKKEDSLQHIQRSYFWKYYYIVVMWTDICNLLGF